MTKPTPQLIEIFRAGKHTAESGQTIEFTAADIAAIAASYDPSKHEAPLVVGHPKTNGPAYGWVKSLHAQGDLLLAERHQVDVAFAEMVNAGRFKKRSASFFLPDSPGNPTPGQISLRHVGFLGAQPPAVKGLRDVSFADGEEGVIEFADSDTRWGFSYVADLFSRLRDYLIDKDGLDAADKVIGDWQVNSLRDAARPASDAANLSYADAPADIKDNDMTDRTAEFAERETKLAAEETRVAALAADLAKKKNDARRVELVSFADGLVAAGKLLPRFKQPIVEVLMDLRPDQVVSFADGAATVEKGSEEILRELLSAMPKQIDFSERSGGDNMFDLSDPVAIADKALEFQREEAKAGRDIPMSAAVSHITKGAK